MKVKSLIRNYSNLRDALLEHKAQFVIDALTGNQHFPVTEPSLSALTDIKNSYADYLRKSQSGEKIAIQQKNEYRELLIKAMSDLALNVEDTSKGNQLMLMTTGFDLASDGETSVTLDVPDTPTVTDGQNPGEIKIAVKGVKNVASYLHQYTLEDSASAVWISKASTRREYLFTGLPSMKKVYFRVIAIGRKEQEAVSSVVSRVVQ